MFLLDHLETSVGLFHRIFRILRQSANRLGLCLFRDRFCI